MSEKQEWIFTFGVGDPLGQYYVVIRDYTIAEARARMVERFGQKWSMQYRTREDACVEKYGLKEIVLK